ncbi:2'-deoxycytidine 5'-triphosphate deaminase [Alphaproteobacteria bacterium]|nr:2'-deoxycytidine 5'-triphosphate deaminase [Alphaproteobacteria bacterium]
MTILNNNIIKNLIMSKSIITHKNFNDSQIQPASLDLTLSNKCYRIKASFIPNTKKVDTLIKSLALTEINLNKENLLEKNCIYLCELNESLSLSDKISAKANPKSTTGRLDIFTRLITDFGNEYDLVKSDYKGKLYLEIIPQSFSIIVKSGISLNQIRFYKNQDKFNSYLRSQNISIFIKKNIICAYKAKKNTSAINLSKINHYKVSDFWEAIKPNSNNIIIEKNEFYILRSYENIKIDNSTAAELEPFGDNFGNFRVHYAGFFDPGFGDNKNGTPAVFELRAYDTPFFVEDKQMVAKLNYYKLIEKTNNSYGKKIKSNYHNQKLKLAKQFKNEK